MREIPVLYEIVTKCCGCGVCQYICPQKAIKMEFDKEGFLYPNIDAQKCIRCYKCIDVCSFKNVKSED